MDRWQRRLTSYLLRIAKDARPRLSKRGFTGRAEFFAKSSTDGSNPKRDL
jgi:hypothetical protein